MNVRTLSQEVFLQVAATQIVRASEWLDPTDVVDEWPVSEEEPKLVSLDDRDPNEDTRPFSRREIAAALDSGKVTIRFRAVLPPPSVR